MADSIVTIISRDAAIKLGLKRYFTGNPCLHGHVAERSTGRNNECVECKRIRDKEYAARTSDRKAEYDKLYRKENEDRLTKFYQDYRKKNRDIINERARLARIQNPDRFRSYKEKRAEKISEEIKAWRQKNKDHVRSYQLAYMKTVRSNKSNYWLASALRQRMAMAIRYCAKSGSAVRDLGCSVEYLKSYLEGMFKEGMTWENWGIRGWHIDHIRPLSSFDLSDRNQFLEACHYTNLQPLWAEENISKGAKVA